MRVDKLKVIPYVTPDEAIKLSKMRTSSDYYVVKDIYNCARAHFADEVDRNYAFNSALLIVWNAGRVQGIREERRKKRKCAEG